MGKRAKKRSPRTEPGPSEDPFLLDDPGGSPLEWIELSLRGLREAVRRGEAPDPWALGRDTDALTERRRRKLQSLSLHRDDEADSVA